MELITTTPPDDFVTAMRQFVIKQGDGRTHETQERYAQVADDLVTFMDGVDVTPWLGAEIAAHFARARVGLGPDAFLSVLGLTSFIRVLPAFLDDPWLPPPGAQRRTQRAAVRYLLTFLRLRATQEGSNGRNDLKTVEKALGQAYRNDWAHPTAGRSGTVRCSVTLDLVEHFVDRLLEEVDEERHTSFDEAIAVRLNPVQVTSWQDPGYDQKYPFGW